MSDFFFRTMRTAQTNMFPGQRTRKSLASGEPSFCQVTAEFPFRNVACSAAYMDRSGLRCAGYQDKDQRKISQESHHHLWMRPQPHKLNNYLPHHSALLGSSQQDSSSGDLPLNFHPAAIRASAVD
ncbi:MAG: hypothetical protein WCD69_10830, partial [Xanthobacteraceae bacterium]